MFELGRPLFSLPSLAHQFLNLTKKEVDAQVNGAEREPELESIHPSIHSFAHSLIHLLIHSFTHSNHHFLGIYTVLSTEHTEINTVILISRNS